ncbi:MAG: GGDEF domain-containing protein [Treponema sp.]|nr:GGDEF domain-containing protein [Treponema sp.]
MREDTSFKNRSIIFTILYTILFGISLFVLIKTNRAKSVSLIKETADIVNTGWYYYDATGKQVSIQSLPISLPVDQTGSASIYRRITTAADYFQYISFYSHHQNIEITINGTTIYRYTMPKLIPWLKSFRALYHIVRIPVIRNGELQIKESPLLSQDSVTFYTVITSNKTNIIYTIVRERSAKLILGFILLISGLFLFCISTLFISYVEKNTELSYLSFITILVGLWQLEESRILQLFIGNSAIHWILEYPIQQIILLTSFLFIQNLMNKKRHIILSLLFWADITTCIIQTALQLTGTLQLTSTIFITHLLLLCTLIAVFIIIIKTTNFKNNVFGILFIIGMGASIFLFMAIIVGHLRHKNTDLLMTTCLIPMFSSLSIIIYQKTIQKFDAIKEAQLYQHLALIDFATGVNSKTAWFSLIEQFTPIPNNKETACLILFDMNNLKDLNDTYGHLTGDKVISTFSSCLKTAFMDYGNIYRIGGDEFICLCRNTKEDKVKKMLARFDSLVKNQRETSLRFTVAYGYSLFTPRTTEDFINAQEDADKHMYDHKRAMKSTQ